MEWLTVVLICLATFRGTRFIADDRLPAPLVEKVQSWAERRWIAKHPDRHQPDSDEWQSQLGYFLQCPWCISIYVGAAIVIASDFFVMVPLPVLTWAAASGVTGLLATYEHSKDD